MRDKQDRIAGVLAAQAVGDSLGSGYEFQRPPARGQAGFRRGTFGHPVASWTDDTEQAVIVALSRSDPDAVAAGLLRWYRGHPVDVGTQTSKVLCRANTPRGVLLASKAYARRQAARPLRPGWDCGSGNGSLMRTGPVALPFLGDRAKVAQAARKVSDLTHYDVGGYTGDACVLWSLAIERALTGGSADVVDIGSLVADGLKFIPDELRRSYWAHQISMGLGGDPHLMSRNGSAVGAFRAALHAVANAESLADGLQLAVSLGGDTDSVAAVAGALLGAIHGASQIPAAWRAKVFGAGPDGRLTVPELEQLALSAAG